MRHANGFTLVELLFALFAGALLLAILASMTGMFVREAARARAQDTDQIADAAPILETLLARAEPPTREDPFEGSASELTANVAPPLSAEAIGSMHLRLAAIRSRAGVALDATLTPIDRAGGGPSRTTRLVDGLNDIQFSYEGEDSTGSSLPKLIVITFKTKVAAWDVVVEPRQSLSAGCRFDPISLSCRA